MDRIINPIEIEPNNKQRKKSVITTIIIVLLVIILAVISAVLVRHYIITTFTVDGISMYPTLDGGGGEYMDSVRDNGDVLYLNKLAKIKRQDIVVFTTPDSWGLTATQDDGTVVNKSLVKRVIAIGGDHLVIQDNIVYLNGEVLTEDYINGEMETSDLDIYIEDGYVFCMGDNRNNSADSRIYGQIPEDNIVGKCIGVQPCNGGNFYLL